MLKGMTPEEFFARWDGILPEGWKVETPTKGQRKTGFKFQQYTPKGKPGNGMIKWQPGGRHGTGWRVNQTGGGRSEHLNAPDSKVWVESEPLEKNLGSIQRAEPSIPRPRINSAGTALGVLQAVDFGVLVYKYGF